MSADLQAFVSLHLERRLLRAAACVSLSCLCRQVTAPSRDEEEATGLVDWLPFLLEDRLKVRRPWSEPVSKAPCLRQRSCNKWHDGTPSSPRRIYC